MPRSPEYIRGTAARMLPAWLRALSQVISCSCGPARARVGDGVLVFLVFWLLLGRWGRIMLQGSANLISYNLLLTPQGLHFPTGMSPGDARMGQAIFPTDPHPPSSPSPRLGIVPVSRGRRRVLY